MSQLEEEISNRLGPKLDEGLSAQKREITRVLDDLLSTRVEAKSDELAETMKAGLKHINGRVEDKLETRFEQLRNDLGLSNASRGPNGSSAISTGSTNCGTSSDSISSAASMPNTPVSRHGEDALQFASQLGQLEARLDKIERSFQFAIGPIGSVTKSGLASRDWVREALRESLQQQQQSLSNAFPARDWVLEQMEGNYDNMKQWLSLHIEEEIHSVYQKEKEAFYGGGSGSGGGANQSHKTHNGVPVPPYVSDLWDSVGTLAARLTDCQVLLDDMCGSKKASKLRNRALETPR